MKRKRKKSPEKAQIRCPVCGGYGPSEDFVAVLWLSKSGDRLVCAACAKRGGKYDSYQETSTVSVLR
jgi:hypothetical protein